MRTSVTPGSARLRDRAGVGDLGHHLRVRRGRWPGPRLPVRAGEDVLVLQRPQLGVVEDAGAGEEAYALGSFEAEAGAAAWDDVQHELGVLPGVELLGGDPHGHAVGVLGRV